MEERSREAASADDIGEGMLHTECQVAAHPRMPESLSPKLKPLARRIAEYAAAGSAAPAAEALPAFRVCEKLRGPLGKVLGVAGFRSLLARAAALAGAEVAWLRALQIRADGSMEELGDLRGKLDREEIAAGEAALTAQLLGLLLVFIGPALTVRLLREVWPTADDLTF